MIHLRRRSWCLLPLTLACAAVACRSNDAAPGATGGTGGGGTRMMGTGEGGGAGTGEVGGSGAGGAGGSMPAAFEALPPNVYAAKVKHLLTGRALTDDELKAVVADPQALRGLIDAWMMLPEFRAKMMTFFQQAFQQTQTDINDYDEQIGFTTNPWNNADKQRFLRAAEESFARTVLGLVDEGRPFTEAVTTERFMLNPPLMTMLAFMDAVPLDDDAKPVRPELWLLKKYPMLTFVRTTNVDPMTMLPVPIPFTDSINPASPNFMHFYEPKPYLGMQPNCKEPQMSANGVQALRMTANYLFGGRPGCGSTDSQWTDADWDAWRWVTIRKPQAGEERTTFWDLPKLRNAATTELVVSTPRVGFMTTMAFFANWPTNLSNSYRVTTNQALIVGLGRSFDDRSFTQAVSETTSDAMHVQPNTACYGCHRTLDPMRDFFRQTYSLSYFTNYAPAATLPATATFNVDNMPVMGTGIRAFAQAMATHPLFATAWTQKLCAFANSAPCEEGDPEFKRVAQTFAASKFDWKTLVRELFSSALVTYATPTKTAMDNGVVISIARREALCAALENRLALPDLCSLRGPLPAAGAMTDAAKIRAKARNLALAIPGGGYARGDSDPLLPHDPNLFFWAASENLCLLLGQRLVDQPAGMNLFASNLREVATMNMVSVLMGLPPSDARFTPMRGILTDHLTEAMAAGASAREATQSAFMLACSSALNLSLGL